VGMFAAKDTWVCIGWSAASVLLVASRRARFPGGSGPSDNRTG
jgi:hypothetical protein